MKFLSRHLWNYWLLVFHRIGRNEAKYMYYVCMYEYKTIYMLMEINRHYIQIYLSNYVSYVWQCTLFTNNKPYISQEKQQTSKFSLVCVIQPTGFYLSWLASYMRVYSILHCSNIVFERIDHVQNQLKHITLFLYLNWLR